MDAIKMIKERRSVRKFKDEKVDRDVIKEIVSLAMYSPTWANSQTARYTVVDDKELLKRLANESMKGFQFNINTASNAAGAVVVSAVKGLSGYSPDGKIVTKKDDEWEMFDAGVASQTFCLAAHEKGIGTVIMGIFDEDKVADMINLPDNEVVEAIIPYGYPEGTQNMPKRKDIGEVIRFI